jgi:hypothetical protein
VGTHCRSPLRSAFDGNSAVYGLRGGNHGARMTIECLPSPRNAERRRLSWPINNFLVQPPSTSTEDFDPLISPVLRGGWNQYDGVINAPLSVRARGGYSSTNLIGSGCHMFLPVLRKKRGRTHTAFYSNRVLSLTNPAAGSHCSACCLSPAGCTVRGSTRGSLDRNRLATNMSRAMVSPCRCTVDAN